MKHLLSFGLLGIILLLFTSRVFAQQTSIVTATVETTAVTHSKDAADDPTIWIHPTDSSKSTIIGTDKGGALEVYRVSDGVRIQQISISGGTNNVDLRYNFPLGTERIDLVVASSGQAFRAYRVDQSTGLLTDITGVVTGAGGGGMSLYHSPVNGEFYYFSNDNCVLKQSRLSGNAGKVNATVVRNISFGNCSGADAKTEGITADDTYGNLYVSEELVAIWKFSAEPNGGSTKTAIDTVASGHFVPDVEGLAIYYKKDGTGYLLASSQGQTKVGGNSNSYVVYQRAGNNAYIGNFRIGDGTVDGTSNTDGIDISNVNLGPKFPQGLFVVQDGDNPGGNQNFKLVPWEQIAGKFQLGIDTSFNPRTGSSVTITPTGGSVSPTAIQATPTEPCPQVPQNTGSAFLSFTVPGSGTYKLLSRIMVPDSTKLYTFWVQIDNQCAQEIGMPGIQANTWKWIDNRMTNPSGKATVFLTEGQHSIKLIGNQPGLKIDYLRFTTDLTCLPTELPGICTPPTPTPTTVISLTPTSVLPTLTPTSTISPTLLPPTKTPTLVPTSTPIPPTKVPTLVPTIVGGQLSLTSIADTFVNSDKRQQNYGSQKSLEVDGLPGKVIYMKFNLASIENMQIKKAVLRVYVTNSSLDKFKLQQVNSTSWNESTLTYANRPSLGDIVTTFNGKEAGSTIEIDITSYIKINAGQVVSIAVGPERNNGLDLASREDSSRAPKIVVTTQ